MAKQQGRKQMPVLTFPVRTRISLARVGAPVPKKSGGGYPWVFRPDLPAYREFQISAKITDRVYLALKKIENLEKIPAEQLVLCALPDAPTIPRAASNAATGAAGVNAATGKVDGSCDSASASGEAAAEVAAEAPALIPLDNPNRTLASYGLQERSVMFLALRSLVQHPHLVVAEEAHAGEQATSQLGGSAGGGGRPLP